MDKPPSVAVVGAGVIGLTVARIFQDRLPSANVTIVADKFREDTVSSVSAGIFTPRSSFKAKDEDTTEKWIRDSWEYWLDILKSPEAPTIGVIEMSTYIFSKKFPNVVRNRMIEGLVPVYRPATEEELSLCGGSWKYGSFYKTLLTDCRYYLPYTEEAVRKRGARFTTRKVDNFDQLSQHDLIFNCSGLGAKMLCNDANLIPLRGQVIKMKAPWIKTAFYGDHDAYIIPGADGTVTLGGTRQYDSYNTSVCRHDAAGILERCCELLPSLKEAEVVAHRVGLRPHRSPVRVEGEVVGRSKVVHCYGHGGYGVTSAPGTAKNAVEIGLDMLKSNLRHKL